MEFVRSKEEIAGNVLRFASELELANTSDRAAMLQLFGTYVVYLPATRDFAPVKYAAVRDISFRTYRGLSAMHEKNSLSRFDSTRMRTHVLKLAGSSSAFVPANPDTKSAFIAFWQRYAAQPVSPGKADKLEVLQLNVELPSLTDTPDTTTDLSPLDEHTSSTRAQTWTEAESQAQVASLIEDDAATRRCIELYAMGVAERILCQRGGHVVDVSANKSWDLEWTHDGTRTLVEVKGTRGTGQKVILTYNEAHLTPSAGEDRALVVVTNIELKHSDEGRLVASGGRCELVYPWEVELDSLRPLSYEYRTPRGVILG